MAGITQLVECKLPKLDVAGSSPVARSRKRLPALAAAYLKDRGNDVDIPARRRRFAEPARQFTRQPSATAERRPDHRRGGRLAGQW